MIKIFFFLQLNPHVNDFQRRYVTEVRRCSEMERKLRWVGGELPEPPPPAKNAPHSLTPREINILEVSQLSKGLLIQKIDNAGCTNIQIGNTLRIYIPMCHRLRADETKNIHTYII